jgi:hypothetical protein
VSCLYAAVTLKIVFGGSISIQDHQELALLAMDPLPYEVFFNKVADTAILLQDAINGLK